MHWNEVQNNCTHIILNGEMSEWFSELQPLSEKTGPTIAHAVASVGKDVLGKVEPGEQWDTLRLVHVLTGDNINTNENVAKRVMMHFQSMKRFGNVKLAYHTVIGGLQTQHTHIARPHRSSLSHLPPTRSSTVPHSQHIHIGLDCISRIAR